MVAARFAAFADGRYSSGCACDGAWREAGNELRVLREKRHQSSLDTVAMAFAIGGAFFSYLPRGEQTGRICAKLSCPGIFCGRICAALGNSDRRHSPFRRSFLLGTGGRVYQGASSLYARGVGRRAAAHDRVFINRFLSILRLAYLGLTVSYL